MNKILLQYPLLKSVAELLAIMLLDEPNVILSNGLVVPIPIFVPLSKTLLLVIVEAELNLTK